MPKVAGISKDVRWSYSFLFAGSDSTCVLPELQCIADVFAPNQFCAVGNDT
jgi:hypothetical protein